MKKVKISPKFQVVIPEEIRVAMRLKPGQTICVFQYDNRIEYIPVKSIKEMRGFLKGIDTEIERDTDRLVPTISIFEVFKKVTKERGEDLALQAVALMLQGRVVALDVSISLTASKISLELNIPMADSIILATARLHKATLWTQDADFCGLDGVRYFKK